MAACNPSVGFAASLISRWALNDLSSEELLGQLNSLWIALPDGDEMKELWRLADFHRGLIGANRYATVGINNSSEVSEFGMSGHDQYYTTSIHGRNPRSVLHIPTAPYRGAHYAAYTPALIAPLILATCPRWCCPVCGQGWAPVVDRIQGERQHVPGGDSEKIANDGARGKHGSTSLVYTGGGMQSNILGYRPTCDHPHTQEQAVPGIVFDPFVGSGTTVMVARQLLRRGIGLDISRPYLREQASKRIVESPKGKWKKQLENLHESAGSK